MSKPRKYTRTTTGTFIRFDPDAKPWPEGVIQLGPGWWEVLQQGVSALVGGKTVRPGDILVLDPASYEADETQVAIDVIPAAEFEETGWEEGDPVDLLRRLRSLLRDDPDVRIESRNFSCLTGVPLFRQIDELLDNHPTGSAEAPE